jgi:3-deoxy-D-manno-octulosonic-acid transferase
MGNSLALGLYLAWSGRGGLSYANRKLQERLKAGKEDPDRIAERRGEASKDRPDGRPDLVPRGQRRRKPRASGTDPAHLEERDDLHGPCDDRHRHLRRCHGRTPARGRDSPVHPAGRPRLRDPLSRPLAPRPRRLVRKRILARADLRNPQARHPDDDRQRPHVETSHDRWRFLRGMARSLLERFDRALVQDDITAMYLRRLGCPPRGWK